VRSPSAIASAAGQSATPASAAKQQQRDRTTAEQNGIADMQPSALADQRVIAPRAVPAPPTDADRRSADARSTDAQLPSTPLPQAAAPLGAASEASARAAPAERAPRTLADTVTVTTNAAQQGLGRRLAVARETVIVSSDPIIRWRIATGGVVDLSTDGGSTWQAHSTGVNVTLTAGSAPSRSVCWLVGPAGVVVVSTDEGRSWQRLAFPASIDLLSVRATDDKTAIVVTSDGRAFSTSDGGRSWRR
jgi:hypothetical protein